MAPEIKSLVIAIPTCNNEDPNVTLPAEWGAPASFPNLVELIIEDGKINGTLPAAWGSPNSFPQLVNLTLRGSSFLSGPLPDPWGSNGSMPRLKSLVMHANRGNAQGCSICLPVNRPRAFTSPLPVSWHQDSFPALETLGLFGFDLTGSLPAEWGCPTCFPNHQVLQLAGSTNLTGTLPVSWSAPGSFQSLKVLNLAAASLTGSIPPAWATNTAFPALTYLSLANTTLTGAIPSFDNPQLAVLDLSFSALSGDITNLWSSKSKTIAAIGLTAVNVTGSIPYKHPDFWKSLRMLVADGTSITGTIPTSWLATAHVSRPPWSKYYTVNSQMQKLSFAGMQLWQRSFKDPAWWPEVCSSLTKLAGYTSIYQKPQYRYPGIEPIDQPSLDVTHQPFSARTRQDDLPILPFLDKVPLSYNSDSTSYYKSFLERSIDDFFHLEGLPSTNLPSPMGQ